MHYLYTSIMIQIQLLQKTQVSCKWNLVKIGMIRRIHMKIHLARLQAMHYSVETTVVWTNQCPVRKYHMSYGHRLLSGVCAWRLFRSKTTKVQTKDVTIDSISYRDCLHWQKNKNSSEEFSWQTLLSNNSQMVLCNKPLDTITYVAWGAQMKYFQFWAEYERKSFGENQSWYQTRLTVLQLWLQYSQSFLLPQTINAFTLEDLEHFQQSNSCLKWEYSTSAWAHIAAQW